MALRLSELKRQRRYLQKIRNMGICLRCRKPNPNKTMYCPKCMITKRKKSSKKYPSIYQTIYSRNKVVTSYYDPDSLFFDINEIIKLINNQLHNYNPTF